MHSDLPSSSSGLGITWWTTSTNDIIWPKNVQEGDLPCSVLLNWTIGNKIDLWFRTPDCPGLIELQCHLQETELTGKSVFETQAWDASNLLANHTELGKRYLIISTEDSCVILLCASIFASKLSASTKIICGGVASLSQTLPVRPPLGAPQKWQWSRKKNTIQNMIP